MFAPFVTAVVCLQAMQCEAKRMALYSSLPQDIKAFVAADPYVKAGLVPSWWVVARSSGGFGRALSPPNAASVFPRLIHSNNLLSLPNSHSCVCRHIKPYAVVVP